MKTILLSLKSGTEIDLGGWTLFAFSDGESMTARKHGSGLLATHVKMNLAGLRKVLAWIDQEEAS